MFGFLKKKGGEAVSPPADPAATTETPEQSLSWRERLFGGLARTRAQLGGKLNNVDVPIRHRLGTPWVGAFDQLER